LASSQGAYAEFIQGLDSDPFELQEAALVAASFVMEASKKAA